jgi:hypothetical protein
MRFILIAILPFFAGCVCDPPMDRLASKKAGVSKKLVLGVPVAVPVANERTRPSSKSVLRTIRVKNCDCPEDFDPHICGDRRAYTWSSSCPSAASVPEVKKQPASFTGSAPP